MGLTLLGPEGQVPDATWDTVEKRVAHDDLCWLDLEAPSDGDIDGLSKIFGFHPLAVDDSRQFRQRPKLVPYDDFAFIVAYGVGDGDFELNEVHCYYRPGLVVTVRQGPVPSIDQWLKKPPKPDADAPGLFLLYRILDALAGSFPPLLDDIDDFLTDLEDSILEKLDPEQLRKLANTKQHLTQMRRAVVPSRDTLGGGTSLAIEELPGMTDEARRYFRDLYDHLVHVGDQLDSEREHAASVMDVYLTTINNRQNDVMKQLTAVSTIFLPLMFLTGFFGMNFAFLVRHINTGPTFLVYGVALQLLSVGWILWLLKRRGWWS